MDEDKENLETMFAWRLAGKQVERWRDMFLLVGFMLVFLFGAGVVGLIQVYVLCKPKYPDASVEQCLSFSIQPKPPGGPRAKP